MRVKLDLKDRKILQALDQNSRASLHEIARTVRLSAQVVDYRLKNLVRRGVIRQFYTVVNFSKLGYTQYKLYFKFHSTGIEKEQEIVKYWKRQNTIWCGTCRGRWDLAVSVLARDVNELGEIISAFGAKYATSILEKNILLTEISPVFTLNYTKESGKKEYVYGESIKHISLDTQEKSILRELALNARIPILELSEKTSITRDVISYRIKKLRQEGILVQHRILVNLQAIDRRVYKIMLRLQNLTVSKEQELMQYMRQHERGIQYLKLLGGWDAELEFEVGSDEELHSILTDIRNRFTSIIRDYETLLIHEEHLLNYFPFTH